MRERACNNCGGKNYEIVGQNMVKCLFCGTLYVDEQASKDEEFLLARANDLLRELKFNIAFEEFNKIISLFSLSFEAFFGRALSRNKIVLYPNKHGNLTRPCFFGETISVLSEDEDFKRAVSLAPAERAKTFLEIARKTEKIKKNYDASTSKNIYDCILCVIGEKEEKRQEFKNEILKILNSKEISVLDFDELKQKDCEEKVFRALETSKIFVCCCLNENILNEKELFDRYFDLIEKHKKTKSSFILCLDKKNVNTSELPKEVSGIKNALDTYSISFLQDLQVRIIKEVENSKKEFAKIETIKIQKTNPKKKEYVDIESITPVELGHYDVQNIEATSATKKKWIFLSLKNGDFKTAQKLVEEELDNDPYSSELLFAQILVEKKIRSEDEFFSKISNFDDKERLTNILRYANKEFAENFVDRWEKLIQQIDQTEIYNQFLTFLASYKNPNREDFIKSAENKAIESLDEQLIKNVEKCFGANEVERFENFYFLLAQKSDDKKFYQKILEIDAGHEQSNIALMLHKFETPNDKLTYRNREEIENMLKFLDEKARILFVSAVVNMATEVAFFNLEEAEKQIDFYLSYIQENASFVALTKKVACDFQQMGFFKIAEKYITLAISKSEEKASLYWILIQIKCHCKSDEEVVMSKIKPTDFPEWETLLEVGDDAHDDMYGAIVSKNSLYSGARAEFVPDLLDKEQLHEKLNDFVLRNKQILIDIEKQEGAAVEKGVNYFRLQLEPFEKLVERIKDIQTFEEYKDFSDKIQTRLDALDLTLDASISVLQVTQKAGLFPQTEPKEKSVQTCEQRSVVIRKKQFIKNFLVIFLEFFPLCFAALLLVFSIAMPKEVYLYFSQNFLIVSMIFSACVAGGNFLYFLIKKQKLPKKNQAVFLSLMGVGLFNMLVFLLSFYVIPTTIKITNENEFATLMQNAQYSNFLIEKDLDFSGKKWKAVDFCGSLDGKNHKISNLNTAFLRTNHGEVKNFVVEVNANPNDVQNFGAFVCENLGEIENCTTYGEIFVNNCEIVGGFAGTNEGKLILCQSQIKIVCEGKKDFTIGGLVGKNIGQSETGCVSKCAFVGEIEVKSSQNVVVGGLIGEERETNQIDQNFADAQILVENSKQATIGGLVGNGRSASKNNYALGSVTTNDVTNGVVGGLYGIFTNHRLDEKVEFSYCNVQISSELQSGLLAGTLAGRMNSCFAMGEEQSKLCVSTSGFGGLVNCKISPEYDPTLNFDPKIWDLASPLPKHLWQN